MVNRLLDWQRTQTREGFKLARIHGSLYYPVDLIELVAEFAEGDAKNDENYYDDDDDDIYGD